APPLLVRRAYAQGFKGSRVQWFTCLVVQKLEGGGWVDLFKYAQSSRLEAGSSKILAHGASESLQYHSGRWWIWGFLNVFLLIRNPLNSEPRTLNLKC
ncbi:MAG TPA: hypothetical protein DDX92_07830, partial [Flavobacteriales bacterium]|nr:hypothetical protein [Flavobacteriales bacterium]